MKFRGSVDFEWVDEKYFLSLLSGTCCFGFIKYIDFGDGSREYAVYLDKPRAVCRKDTLYDAKEALLAALGIAVESDIRLVVH